MSTTQEQINKKLFEAAEAAKSNPYIQKLMEDEDMRDNAIDALKSARKAYDRASSKGWDKKLAKDKKLRKEIEDAVKGIKQTRDELVEAPKEQKKHHPLRKLFLIALVGGIVAIAVNEDMRKKLLDTLFGAEEEFKYSSTTSTNGKS